MSRTIRECIFVLLCLFSLGVNAAWVTKHGLTSVQYQAEFDKYVAQGYRLTNVSGYTVGNTVYYAGIWEDTPGPAWVSRHGMTSSSYKNLSRYYSNLGYQQIYVSAYNQGNTALFAAIWDKSNIRTNASHDLTAARFMQLNEYYTGKGSRIKTVSGYAVNGVDYYAAIWEQNKILYPKNSRLLLPIRFDRIARTNMSDTEFQSYFDSYLAQGYRLYHVDGYDVAGTTRFSAIWANTSGPEWLAQHNIANQDYQTTFNDKLYEGYQLQSISGYVRNGQAHFATIWQSVAFANSERDFINAQVEAFMSTYNVPSVSIAIAKDEKLIYAKAFGFADTNVGEMATTDHRFRIASLTKPITATAAFKLIEEGKLSLDDTIFGAQGILGQTYGTLPYDPSIEMITVEDLLQHTSGGWSNYPNDPSFENMWLDKDALISWTLDNYPITTPGTSFAYSNFGYFLMGRVIEEITGSTYGDYVQSAIFEPVGAPSIALAHNTLAERLPNEVVYYDNTTDPYGFNIENMDSQGGWVATPVELLKFLVRVDGRDGKTDILQAASVDAMVNSPSVAPDYSHGWIVTLDNRWHDGSVQGTRTIMGNLGDGYAWAILTNTRDAANDYNYFLAMDQLPFTIVNNVSDWPKGDFFVSP